MGLLDTTREAFLLLFSGDRTLWGIVWVSIKVSVLALILAGPLAVAMGFVLAYVVFPGRRLLVILVQVFQSFPTVVVGLLLYLLLSRQGPLGALHLLFTQPAMILGQMAIVFPVLAAYTLTAVQGADPRAYETAVSLSAGRLRAAMTTLREVRFGVMAAVFMGFGRIISEIGCSLMVGGNIAGHTRNIPTAIALETSKGEFAQGVALGIVLIVLALSVNVALAAVQGQGGMRREWQA
ncbi:MAG TPA: ABC transporter permease [Burkholderiales bacterium]|nr:ABC transporter permease [Burkholderiales bacterium]